MRQNNEQPQWVSKGVIITISPHLRFFTPLCHSVVIFFLFLLSLAPVWGQTAAEIEGLLSQKEITCAQAAYFTLAMALDNPPANGEGAFVFAREQGWLPAQADSSGPITMGGLSLLVMKAFDLKGGLLYRLFENPRYAFREMTDRGFISGRAYSTLTVSGEQFLRIAGNVLTYIGDGQ